MSGYTRNIGFWLTTNSGDEPENARLLLAAMKGSGTYSQYKVVQQRNYTVIQGPESMLILEGEDTERAFLLRLQQLATQPEE